MEQFIKPIEISFESSKDIDEHGKKLSLEDYSIKIIGTRPPISSCVSPIGQNIVIPNTNSFSGKIPDHNRQTCRQHKSYYQPQPAIQNHFQQYLCDVII